MGGQGRGGWRHKQSAALSPAPCLCCVTAVLMLCPRVSERPIVLRICKNDPHTQQLKLDPSDQRPSRTLIYPPRFKRTTSKHHWVQPTVISPLSLLEMICIQSINHDTLDQWEASIQVTGSFSTNDRPVSSSLLIMFNIPGSRLLHHPFVWTE